MEREMIPRSKGQVINQMGFNKDSKKFHEGIFSVEEEMDKFFEANPNAEGFEIYNHFHELTNKEE